MGTTKRVESPVFTIEEGTVVKEPAGSRTNLVFNAKASREKDCAFELSDVRAMVFDKEGHFITRRGHNRARSVLSNRAFWINEIPADQLALAARVVYEIEYRYETRRKLVAGELPPLAAESDSTEYFRWLTIDPRTLEDRAARYDFTLYARPTDLFFTYGFTPKVVTDSFRNDFELDFLDADHNVVLSKNFGLSQNMGRGNFEENDIYNVERKIMRTLKFFELRVRTEVRHIVDLEVTDL